MRIQTLLCGAAFLALAATTAQAQTVVTIGSGRAHDCFVYAKTGDQSQKGVAICNQALEFEILSRKDRAGTYDNRGVILDMMGRAEEAASDFHTAIALDPELGDAYVNLGAVMIKKGQHQEALDQINKGISLGVSFAYVGYYNRAVAEQILGRYKEAYYDYKKALEIEPNFTMASERLKDFTVTRAPVPRPS
jgi:tetratricopeptide (TPR) repeat protein